MLHSRSDEKCQILHRNEITDPQNHYFSYVHVYLCTSVGAK